MKLLVVTSLKEYQKDVANLLVASGITAYSVTETVGFKNHATQNLLDNWFSKGEEKFDSIFFFSFTDDSSAEQALTLIGKHNEENTQSFPLRAFVLAVEKAS